MTIYWDPVEDDTDPDTIEVWHVADDGTESGPLTVDVSGVSGVPDSVGGLAPDAVRREIASHMRDNYSITDSLIQNVIWDMLELDYKLGSPP